jgi:hypothetical protein
MMRYNTIAILTSLLLFTCFVCGQTSNSLIRSRALVPKVTTIYYQLGYNIIPIRTYQYGDSKDLFFINLHDDEVTAVNGAIKLLEIHGGTLLRIVNKKQRNITFKMGGVSYLFDPNRIFSRHGISQTLSGFGRVSNKAVDEVERFAKRILQFIPPRPTCIIALHNNSDGKFSVTSYLKGNDRENDARAIHISPQQDPDDLFLTTDSVLYRNLTKEKFNVVWQDNRNAYKDGSLSVYCGEKNICYLNCETEHGKLSQYTEMMLAVNRHIKNTAPDVTTTAATTALVYNYKLSDSTRLPESSTIYFGEKKIGLLKPGQMEIAKTFPLYDNMDIFCFVARNADPRIELRIDPTRPRKLYDPANAVIPVKIVR